MRSSCSQTLFLILSFFAVVTLYMGFDVCSYAREEGRFMRGGGGHGGFQHGGGFNHGGFHHGGANHQTFHQNVHHNAIHNAPNHHVLTSQHVAPAAAVHQAHVLNPHHGIPNSAVNNWSHSNFQNHMNQWHNQQGWNHANAWQNNWHNNWGNNWHNNNWGNWNNWNGNNWYNNNWFYGAFFGSLIGPAFFYPYWFSYFPYTPYSYYDSYPYVTTTTYSSPAPTYASPTTTQSQPSETWVASQNGVVPVGAVVNGNENGSVTYYCRGTYLNQTLYGVLVPNDGCYITNQNSSLRLTAYNVLVSTQ